MKVTVIQIIIDALGTANKGLVQGQGGLGNKRTSGDHPNTALFRSVRILKIVLETGGDLLSLKVQ